MKYRALSPSGDFLFASGAQEFLQNSPDAVAQAVETRLRLMQGEWFLNLDEGTPYGTQILGAGTQPLYDQAIQNRILGTQGVVGIAKYSSNLDSRRNLSVEATVDTIYGAAAVKTVL